MSEEVGKKSGLKNMDMKTRFSLFNSEDDTRNENSTEPKLTITYLQNDDSERSKLFVGGLSWETTQETLKSFFGRYGEVIDCVVMKNQETGRSRGFGFITYKDPSCVQTVLASGPHNLDGRTIDPKACNPRSMQKVGAVSEGTYGGGNPSYRMPKNKETKVRKIFIGGLPANCTETDLTNYFSQYGKVTEVVIMYDQQKQRSRGFGFLSFESEDSVERVIGEHYVSINGKQIECKRAEPRDTKLGGKSGGSWGGPPMGGMPNGMPGQMNMAAGAWGQQGWGAPQGFGPQGVYGPPPQGPPFQSWGPPGAPSFGSFPPPPPGPFGPPPHAGFGGAEGMPDDMSTIHPWSSMNNGAPPNFAYAGYGVPPPAPGTSPGAPVPSTGASDAYSAAVSAQLGTPGVAAAISATAATATGVTPPVPPPTQPPKTDLNAFSNLYGTMGSYPQEASSYGPARAFGAIQDGMQTPNFGAFGVPMPGYGQSDQPFGVATGTSGFGRGTSPTPGYHPYRR